MTRPLIIYHALCSDGAGAAYAAWCKFGDDAEYRPASYGEVAPTSEEVTGRDVFILDFSYSRPDLERLRAAAAHLRVIDHHKTAQAALGDLDCAVFDMEHSGAVLAWHHFHGAGSVPEILLYIEDRDLWHWKLAFSKEISAALEARNVLRDFHCLVELSDQVSNLVAEGRALLRQQQLYVDALTGLGMLRRGLAGDTLHYVVNSYLLHSELGNVLATRSATEGYAPLAAVWHQMNNGRYKVSLRSVGICDVSTIAERFGGGGHKNAASFHCDVLPWS